MPGHPSGEGWYHANKTDSFVPVYNMEAANFIIHPLALEQAAHDPRSNAQHLVQAVYCTTLCCFLMEPWFQRSPVVGTLYSVLQRAP
jgi:hypothetical protein